MSTSTTSAPRTLSGWLHRSRAQDVAVAVIHPATPRFAAVADVFVGCTSSVMPGKPCKRPVVGTATLCANHIAMQVTR